MKVIFITTNWRENYFNMQKISKFVSFFLQAILLGQTNRLDQAMGIMMGLVQDDPNNPGHYKTLAGMYAQNRQLDEVSCLRTLSITECSVTRLVFQKPH